MGQHEAVPAPHGAMVIPWGRFAQRGHSANHYGVHPGTPANHLPTKACMIHSKQHRGAEFGTLGPLATGGGTQPTFRTARAQHGYSAWCAPLGAPETVVSNCGAGTAWSA